jgi:DNA invertase Pin-like site-specific DNA recombinase
MEEGMETEEVLARHQKTLIEYAERHQIRIVETYCEVVSGESLYARPEMLRLLEDVSEGEYEAVMVMDLDRLSRGRMKDQGIILDAFRDSGTRIITPDKTYDLSDDIDDELAEFKTFMSRREYKIINKRLRRGLEQSIRDGYYVSNPPYGYKRIFIDKRPTLEIVESEASFVRMMYDMYLQGFGCTSIANHINLLGARPHRSNGFSRNSVATILRSPTYIGKIAWDKKKHIKKGAKGNAKHITIYQPKEKWTVVDGVHPPIVTNEIFEQAQEIMEGRYIPSKKDGTIKSSLAGLIRCQNCGRNMQRMTMKEIPYLICVQPGCCASAKFEFVERRVIMHLEDILVDLMAEKAGESNAKDTSLIDEMLTAIRRELTAAESQKARLYDLLEMGEYDLQLFRERMSVVKAKIETLQEKEQEALDSIKRIQQTDKAAQAKKIDTVLASYAESDAPQRNALLHSIVDVIWYDKPKKTKPTAFNLQIDLKPF